MQLTTHPTDRMPNILSATIPASNPGPTILACGLLRSCPPPQPPKRSFALARSFPLRPFAKNREPQSPSPLDWDISSQRIRFIYL